MIYYRRGNLIARTATKKDLAFVAERMRQSDKDEAMASHGFDPMKAVVYSSETSLVTIAVEAGGEPIAVFGIAAENPRDTRACIWLLGTDGIEKNQRAFLRFSRVMIAAILKVYPELWNMVPESSTKTIRWLEWCGAKFSSPSVFGPNNAPFVSFSIKEVGK